MIDWRKQSEFLAIALLVVLAQLVDEADGYSRGVLDTELLVSPAKRQAIPRTHFIPLNGSLLKEIFVCVATPWNLERDSTLKVTVAWYSKPCTGGCV
jgi:hypothetical protein